MILIMCLSIFLGRNKRLPDEGTKGLVAKKDSSICSTRGSVPVGRHAKQPFLVQAKAPCIDIKNSKKLLIVSCNLKNGAIQLNISKQVRHLNSLT